MLPERLEKKLAAQVMRTKDDQIARQEALQCPPISPHLLRHLKIMFSYPIPAKPNNPELAQMLMIQFGVEKVLHYLRSQYDQQSAAARKEHAG